MARLLFDANRQLDTPTLVLEAKSGKVYGAVDGFTALTYKKSMSNPQEISFNVSKYINGKVNRLWDNITDFKTIYIPEYKEKFEIVVSYSDDEQEEKSVTGTFLCASELSQTLLRGLEINTDSDLEAKNYKVTTFYNPNDTEISLLHRVLSQKCSHYTISHVDKSLWDLAFEFTADEKSVYDFLVGDVAEKIQCLFLFDSITREISVYDLCSTCNDCYDEVIGKDSSEWKHYRDDFHDVCPKCGSTNITEGYGKDTTILIDRENVATSITRETDADSLKNCLHVSGGDDLIDAAFIMSNPNGSQYIYRFTDEMMSEMPQEFKSAWNKYYKLYEEYNTAKKFSVDTSIISSFDTIVNNVSSLHEVEPYNEIEPYSKYKNHITPELKGVKALSTAYYNAIDMESLIETSMCPTYQVTKYDKYEALAMLNSRNIGTVAIAGFDNKTTKQQTNNAVLLIAKTIINTAMYEIDIESSTYSSGTWNGVFSVKDRKNDDNETNTVTNVNYIEIAEKEGRTDISTTIPSSVTVTINGDVDTYCKNQIKKKIEKSDLPVSYEFYDLTLTDEFEKKLESMIPLYSIANLEIINNTLLSCREVLETEILNNKNTNEVIKQLKLYKSTYSSRMSKIDSEIEVKNGYLSTIGKYKEAMNTQIKNVHNALKLEDYLKSHPSTTVNLWNIFNYYRREDTYKNENIISDNLDSNASLLQYADYLMNFAEKELIKASTPQISISSNLHNLLMLPEFEPLLESFEVGNWIRVRTDINEEKEEDSIYKLRLLSYQIPFDNQEEIEVEFSTVTQTWSGMRDVQNILNSAQTIATNFDSVKRDIQKSATTTKTVNNWVNDGLDLTNQKIVSDANNQSIVIDEHGILGRKYDDITESFDDCQIKFFNNGLFTTHDNWKSIDAGVGKFIWKNPDNNWKPEETYGIIARKICGEVILGEEAMFTNSTGSMSFTGNGLSVSNDKNTININPNGNAFEILKDSEQQLYIDTDGNINLKGHIDATSIKTINGEIGGFSINEKALYYNCDSLDSTENGVYLGTDGILTSGDDGCVIHANFYSEYKYKDDARSLVVSPSGINLYTTEKDGYLRSSSITSYLNDNAKGAFDENGVLSINQTYGFYWDGDSFFKQVTIDQNKYIRGLATDGSSKRLIGVNNSDIVTINSSSAGGTTDSLPLYIYSKTQRINFIDTSFNPNDNLSISLGTDSKRWSSLYVTNVDSTTVHCDTVYANHSEIATSDRNKKNCITDILPVYEEMFIKLQPKCYMFNDGDRIHIGAISQDVEDILFELGLTAMDFGGFCKDIRYVYDEFTEDGEPIESSKHIELDTNGNIIYDYALRYQEFIMLTIHMVQKNIKRIETLEFAIQDLQNKYNELVQRKE